MKSGQQIIEYNALITISTSNNSRARCTDYNMLRAWMVDTASLSLEILNGYYCEI